MRALTLVVLLTASIAAAAPAVDPRALPGWPIYDRYCLPCHGASGDGRGPAAGYTTGQPRAFARGDYEWRSTPIGQPPTDDDLRTAIRYGAPGTSMPGFEYVLGAVDIERLLEVLKAFEPATFARAGKPIAIRPAGQVDAPRGAQLWTQHGCDKCHGASGRGDGPSTRGQDEPPYDLTTQPLRRPRATDDPVTRRRAAMLSIATGLAGTPMPGFAGPLGDADLWALADHVIALNARAKPRASSTLDVDTIAADRIAGQLTGTWPGTDREEARVFGAPLAPQGVPPAQLVPAQAALSADRCARCHAKQAREWKPSVHAAATIWGLPAREADHGTGDDSCDRCHAPLAEQQQRAGVFDAALHREGVTCAGCHLRQWVRRGPPRRAPSLLPAAGYPLVELAIYERADFCMPCHQLPPRTAVNGKPLLNTYKEWLEGPYLRRGIQCQHCHMPNREHTWLGIHDRDTFRQAIRLDASAVRAAAGVTVVATLANVGAGHDLPTTPTPAVWLRIELIDGVGRPIKGARGALRIGRELDYADGWRERGDTRIPAGEQITTTRAWTAGRVDQATSARITVEVYPDDYYERLFVGRLAGNVPAAARKLYEAALARAKASHYIAEQRDVAIAAIPRGALPPALPAKPAGFPPPVDSLRSSIP